MSKIIKQQDNKIELEIKIPPKDFNDAVEKAYQNSKNKINVPGFRKGKTPRVIIENYYGSDVFFEDAINLLLPDLYDETLAEHELKPIDRPKVDTNEMSKENGAVVSIKLEVEPTVDITDYKGIKIPKIAHPVTDDDVNAELEGLQNRNARTITPDDDYAIKTGDIATIDFEGFFDGVPFNGGKGENHPLVIGSGTFIPGFEEQLIGAKKGDEIDVKLTFPKDYHSAEHAGRDAVFKVKINKVETRELSKLDDDFAQDVSEFDTLAELKADIRSRLEKSARERERTEKSDAIIDEIIKQITIEIPEPMIQDELYQIAHRMEHNLAHQGIDFDTYLKITGLSYDQFSAENRERAINQVKANLAIKHIAKLENIEISDAEIENKYDEIAIAQHVNVEQVKAQIPKENIIESLKIDKVIDILIENCKTK